MVTYCLDDIRHTYVYRKNLYLSAGVMYIFETSNLQPKIPWRTPIGVSIPVIAGIPGLKLGPDTVMYLVYPSLWPTHPIPTIVAYNDDYNGFASLFAYQPTQSGYYTLIIRGHNKFSSGTCDVYQSTAGNKQKIDTAASFGGYPVAAHWKSDETILTTNTTGDTYLFIFPEEDIIGSQLLYDDDSGEYLCSQIVPGYEGWGKIVVGSYSKNYEGITSLCNYYQSYLDNPGGDEKPKVIISDNMFKFQQELIKYKSKLKEMPLEEMVKKSIGEQEAEVKKIRDKYLTEEDLELLKIPSIEVPQKFIDASEKYMKILEKAQKELESLPYEERILEMEKLELHKKKIFKNITP